MAKVQKPDLYRRHDHSDTPPPIGPRNLVVEWAVEPFHQSAGDDWIGEQVFVLSLWSEDGPTIPFQFCLSDDAVLQISKGLGEILK